MDFNGSEIRLTFILLTRINVSGNYWKSSLNESDRVLSKEGRIWFIELPLKIHCFLTCPLPLSHFSFKGGKIKKKELFDTRRSEDSF